MARSGQLSPLIDTVESSIGAIATVYWCNSNSFSGAKFFSLYQVGRISLHPLKGEKYDFRVNHQDPGRTGMRETIVDIVRLPGGTLLVWLFRHSADRGMSKEELAGALGVSYGYMQQLRSGLRAVPQVSDEFAAKCAAFLDLPKLLVLYAAGKLTAADGYRVDALSVFNLARALDIVLNDPKFGPMVKADLLEASPRLKLSFIQLYEQAAGRSILGGRCDFPDLEAQLVIVSAKSNKVPEVQPS